MGGSESRCCTDAAEGKAVPEKTAGIDNTIPQTESPFKSTKILDFDPRSPSQSIDRTPIEIISTPVQQPKPLMRVQPMQENTGILRKRNVENAIHQSSVDPVMMDPRSPGPPGCRTPIILKGVDKENKSVKIMDPVTISEILDPRSPSQGVTRTPLLVEDSVEVFYGEGITEDKEALVICETPKKPLDMDKGETNAGFEADPRSPSSNIERTPLVEKPEHHTNAVCARNLHDPRSPTTDVSRTPIGALFSGHRELRRTVLMSNALMASPLSKKITRSTLEVSEKKPEIIDDPNEEVDDISGDEIPAVLRCNLDLNNSCSSSMVASIGSEVDCISLNDSFDDDDDQASMNTIDSIEIDLMTKCMITETESYTENGNGQQQRNTTCDVNEESMLTPSTDIQIPPDVVPKDDCGKPNGVESSPDEVLTGNQKEDAICEPCHVEAIDALLVSERVADGSQSEQNQNEDIVETSTPLVSQFNEKFPGLPNDSAIDPHPAFESDACGPQSESNQGEDNAELANHGDDLLAETAPSDNVEEKPSEDVLPEVNLTPSSEDVFSSQPTEPPLCVDDELQNHTSSDDKIDSGDVCDQPRPVEDDSNSNAKPVPCEPAVDEKVSSEPAVYEKEILKENVQELEDNSVGAIKVAIKKPQRKLRAPSTITNRKRTDGSPTAPISRKTSEKALARRPKAKSTSEDTSGRGKNRRENSTISVGKQYSKKTESRLVGPRQVRSPLTVLTNDANSDKGQLLLSPGNAQTPATKLPRYRGTPPSAGGRTLSVSFSGRPTRRSQSVDGNRSKLRSFSYNKEN